MSADKKDRSRNVTKRHEFADYLNIRIRRIRLSCSWGPALPRWMKTLGRRLPKEVRQ